MSVLAALGLTTALAFGGTVVGCGSSSGGETADSGPSSSGTDSGPADTGSKPDTGADSSSSSGGDSGPADTGPSSSGADTGPTCSPNLAAPTFSPPDGTQVASGSSVTINPPAGFPSGGTIFFTTNGTIPTHASSVYIGPIQVTAPTTIFAIATAPGACDSPAVHAQYGILPVEATPVTPPVFNPTSQSQNNDFLVSLSTNPGDTICYRLDGNTPTCSAGACTGGSQTYNGASQVSINGSVTDPTTGKVTVTAIACDAAGDVSSVVTQVYQLIVADPTMVNPAAASNIPWVTGGLQPTVSTITVTSNETSSVWYTTSGTAPTCITGTQVPNPTTFGQAPGGVNAPALTKNTTIQAIGCKQGYLHSNVVPFAYTIQLNTPKILAGGTYHYTPHIWWAGTAAANQGIDDAANVGVPNGGDVLCASITGTPSCGLTPGGAATCSSVGNGMTTAGTALTIGNNTTDTTTVNMVACAPAGLNSSGSATQTYKLQYAQAYIYTTQGLVGTATDLPGWDWQGASNPPGGPVTSMQIPNAANQAAPGYPYKDGGHWNANVVQNLPCTGTAGTGIQTSCTGAPAFQAPDFYCTNLTGNAACSATCTGFTTQAQATGAAGLQGTPGVTSTAGSNTLSIIPCQNAGAAQVYSSPAPTGLTFSGANQATAPTVQAQSATGTVQATVAITNNDATVGGSWLCATFGNVNKLTPDDPTCGANGHCTSNGSATNPTMCWAGAANGWVTAPNAACAVTAAKGQTGNSVTVSPGPSGGTPGAPNGPGLVQTNGEVIKAIACNAVESASPNGTATYNFAGAEPDFTDAKGAAASPPLTGDLNSATSIGAGAPVFLTSTSNFNVPAPVTKLTIHWANGTTADCGAAGVVTLNSVNAVTGGLADVWANGLCAAGTTCNGNPVAPTTGTTWDLAAVVCGQNDGVVQQLSPVRHIQFQLAAAQPTITTNQFTGTSVPGCTGPGSTTCAPQPIWENTFNAYVNSTTPGTSICWSTTGAPTCTGGTCGGGSTQVASGTAIPITASNTNLQVLGCAPGLPQSAPVNYQVTMNTTKAVAGQGSVSCGGTTTVALSNSDTALGGPTHNACVCYTTDGTAPACQATCPATIGTATCFSSGGAGTNVSGPITISGTTTIKTNTCAQGFNPTQASQAYSIAPYTHTITVDGNLGEWNTGAFAGDEAVPVVNNFWSGPPQATGFFTYDATNAYVGVNLAVNAHPDYYLGVYIGTAGATGASKELPPLALELGGVTRSVDTGLGILYAILWQTTNGTAPGTYAWSTSNLVWSPQTFTVNVGYDTGTNTVEFGVPLSAVGTPPVITMFASHIQNVGYSEQPTCGTTNNTGGVITSGFGCTIEDFESYRFPYNGHGTGFNYADAFQDTRSSCLPPNVQFH